ncbi:unnamed protein product [Macrosiphum euphorbiae]|uniref:Transposable element P transposase n=1 Tax=Macrosiphum euphorbiae TaxID=13131 RepID=A0AAV0WE99_9HEMI|nr:unnamed protein product [Macrosiphum euphorbiae]
MFVLPCRKTLSNMLALIPINTGIDPTLIKVLKENVKNLKPKYRFCSILFDEISLNAGLQYNSNEGTIYGFEENNSGRTQQFADHSLVFMIRGIVKNFKQPICYSFCKSTTNRHDLAHQIREVIKAVQSTGLKVISTICDQGATNSAAINILINDTKAYYWKNNKEYNGDFYEVEYKFGNSTELIKIFHLFDPPHLLKGIRNNLLTKNVSFDMDGKKVASWRDIMNLYELDSSIPDVKMLPRLTKEHVVPNEIRKMKVRNAAQVLSQIVSSIMAFLASKNLIGETAGDTAKFCLFFDKLFDSVNSNYDKVVDGKIYRAGLKKNSPHHQLWKDSLKILSTMRFLSPSTGKPSTPQPPTLKNWIKTIKSFQNIFQVLSDKGIQVLLLRHFNQDSLENFFGALRALGYRNNNPTCEMFSSAYKTLLLNNIMSTHSPGSNCEDDFSEACLVSYQTLFATFNNKLDTDEPEFDRQRVADLPKEKNPSCASDLTLLETQTKNYIAGFIVKKLNTIFFKNCDVCMKEICSNINNDHQIIQARDYQPNGKHLLKYKNKDTHIKGLKYMGCIWV